MSVRGFAKQAQVAPSTIQEIEASEADGRISMAVLNRYAKALDCELRYVLVPRRPLKVALEARAEELAREEVGRVAHSMALENQATSKEFRAWQVKELKRKLLEGPRSRLWR
jgi:predicted DNA-binding mobile mystery protein A